MNPYDPPSIYLAQIIETGATPQCVVQIGKVRLVPNVSGIPGLLNDEEKAVAFAKRMLPGYVIEEHYVGPDHHPYIVYMNPSPIPLIEAQILPDTVGRLFNRPRAIMAAVIRTLVKMD